MRINLSQILLFLSSSYLLMAKGTQAGTDIENSATISYQDGGTTYDVHSSVDKFVVDRIVDVKMQCQQSEPVEVGAGEVDRVLTFAMSSLGNSEDNVTVSYLHESSDFAPESVRVFEDSNDNGVFDSSDTEINIVEMGIDETKTIFVAGNIPDDVNRTEESNDTLIVASKSTHTATKDTQNSIDTVIRDGEDSDSCLYKVRNYWLESVKSQEIHGDDNTTHTGTIITYSIDLSIGGDGDAKTIKDIHLKDLIPEGTKYVDGSLKLDGASASGYSDGEIDVSVPDISGDTHHIVTFDVQVQ